MKLSFRLHEPTGRSATPAPRRRTAFLRLALILPLLLLAHAPAAPARSQPSRAELQANAPAAPSAEGAPASAFPRPARRVARIVSDEWSEEQARDRFDEAGTVMDLLDIRPGMAVADIGAGRGYFAVRLATRVGPDGRVTAEDIVPGTVERLRGRIGEAGLPHVDVVLGRPHDPRLPAAAYDRAVLVHMYHEVEQPFGLLWNLAPSLKPGGLVGIVDADRPTDRHGTPPDLLRCELGVAGYREVAFHPLQPAGNYLAVFAPVSPRPDPADMRPCGQSGVSRR
jgi:protein-L-isoaspartate O-methyltransferase